MDLTDTKLVTNTMLVTFSAIEPRYNVLMNLYFWVSNLTYNVSDGDGRSSARDLV